MSPAGRETVTADSNTALQPFGADMEAEPAFVTIRCRTCDGVAHPATGCVYSPTFIVCGPCVRSFWSWVVRHTNAKGRRRKGQAPSPSFYEHVNRLGPKLIVEPGA